MQAEAVSRSADVARELSGALQAGLRPLPCRWPAWQARLLDAAAARLDAAARSPAGSDDAVLAATASLDRPSRGLLRAVAAGADPLPLLAVFQQLTDAGRAARTRRSGAFAYPAVVCVLAVTVAFGINAFDRPKIDALVDSLTGRGLPSGPLTSTGRLILPLVAIAALAAVGWRLIAGARVAAGRRTGLAAAVRAALDEAGCPPDKQALIVADMTGGPPTEAEAARPLPESSTARAARWWAVAALHGVAPTGRPRRRGMVPAAAEGTAAVLLAGLAVLLCGLALHGPLVAMVEALAATPAAPLWGATP